MFSLNLCGEFTKYTVKKNAYVAGSGLLGIPTKADIDYGYKLVGEFEPHFSYDLGKGSNFSASLPVTYTMQPGTKYNGTAEDNSDSYSLSLTPTVGYMFMAGPLPLEVSADYSFPVMGKNVDMALNSVTLQFKTYLKF